MQVLLITILQYHRYGQSAGESTLIGAITGLVIWGLSALVLRKDKKQAIKEDTLDRLKSIAKDKGPEARITNDDYAQLYETLIDLCNPSNYMSPYDSEKVRLSNEIYSKLPQYREDITGLIEIRNDAVKKLGIKISPANIASKLKETFSPLQFTGEHYDAAKLEVANEVYKDILAHENDIIELEEIAKRCGLFDISNRPIVSNEDKTQELGLDTQSHSKQKDYFALTVTLVVMILCGVIIGITNIHSGAKENPMNVIPSSDTEPLSSDDEYRVQQPLLPGKTYRIIFLQLIGTNKKSTIEWNCPGLTLIWGPTKESSEEESLKAITYSYLAKYMTKNQTH